MAAAILAGGDAVRMSGQNKALIEVDGRRIIERQLDVLGPLFDEVFVVANDPAPYARLGLRVVPDVKAGQGPLMGLCSALQHTTCERLFVVACDMPRLHKGAIRLVCDFDDGIQASMPRIDEHLEPLFACYSKDVATVAEQQLAARDYKLSNLTFRLRCRFVDGEELRKLDPSLQFLQNYNTPQDLDGIDGH